jgi:hypothetical protein
VSVALARCTFSTVFPVVTALLHDANALFRCVKDVNALWQLSVPRNVAAAGPALRVLTCGQNGCVAYAVVFARPA